MWLHPMGVARSTVTMKNRNGVEVDVSDYCRNAFTRCLRGLSWCISFASKPSVQNVYTFTARKVTSTKLMHCSNSGNVVNVFPQKSKISTYRLYSYFNILFNFIKSFIECTCTWTYIHVYHDTHPLNCFCVYKNEDMYTCTYIYVV